MKYQSLSNDIRRVKRIEQIKEDQLNKLISNIGQEIQQNIDDPYKYLIKRNYSIEDRTLIKRDNIQQRRPKGSMSIAEIWTKKMKKQCDKILEEMKKKQNKQMLDLSKQQSIDNRQIDESIQSPQNASAIIEQLGLKALMGKTKQKDKNKQIVQSPQQKLQSQSQILTQSPQPIRDRFASNFHFEPTQYSPIQQYHHNSQSTSCSTKNLINSNFRKYSIKNEVKREVNKCLYECDSLIQNYQDVDTRLKQPSKSRLDIFVEKQRREALEELIFIERNKPKNIY
ncbi:unnamed protein product (macronuclear) [Paramecium tetraurelia]|uniref:Enkurin domain-containing protein n=1 Tax=Paramecium tetraurelia TaxID=5888 RepID=A0DUR9_PARTE|nr:uncharacterized protein GSPATT00020458001 [Paramecium tetraurelia]CAK86786.1 unnamed protein product [Paramecium tetraurelia]|eukprot:XP_001454183.1 hypothetical protein (macronuclear) [Paramecium tetraurelia strain d4-2]